MKLIISPLSSVIKCNLNQKNHPIGDFLCSASPQISHESESSDYDIHLRGIESTRLIHVQVLNGTFLMKMLRGESVLPSPVPRNGYKTPCMKTGISDIYGHIPCDNA